MLDKKKLALIHIVKKELNLSDSEYRQILKSTTGKESAKDLDEAQFRKMMHYFVRSNYYRINPLGFTLKQKLYIDYLAKELGWDNFHLSNFINKYYHRSGLKYLSRQEAAKLIESLKNIIKHKKEVGNA